MHFIKPKMSFISKNVVLSRSVRSKILLSKRFIKGYTNKLDVVFLILCILLICKFSCFNYLKKDDNQLYSPDDNNFPSIPITSISLNETSSYVVSKVKRPSKSFFLFIIILSGDIQMNPGPGVNLRYSCPKCNRTVAKNHRAVQCDKHIT